MSQEDALAAVEAAVTARHAAERARQEAMRQAREAGVTFAAIGEVAALTPAGVYRLVHREFATA